MKKHELEIHFNRILIDELKKYLSLSPKEMPKDLGYKNAAKGAGKTTINSELYACEKTGDVRIGKNIMAESMYVEFGIIPPGEDYDFPIMGFDFVNSKKCLIAVFDFHPLRRDDEYYQTYIAPIEQIFSRYQHIPSVKGGRTEIHDWAKTYDSGFGFYRWCERSYLPQIEQAFREYTCLFSQFIKQAKPIEDPAIKEKRDKFMQQYKEDFILYDPGSGPLKHLFGEEWAERFMRDFLFK